MNDFTVNKIYKCEGDSYQDAFQWLTSIKQMYV